MLTYRARRRLEMAPGVWREPDELIPEAHAFHRLDSYLHTGYIVETDADEAEIRAAVKKYCSADADRLLELIGLGDAVLEGPQRTPRLYVTKTEDPAPKKAAAKKASSKEA